MRFRFTVLFALQPLLPLAGRAGTAALRQSVSARPVPGMDFDLLMDALLREGGREALMAELAAVPGGGRSQPGESILLALMLQEAGRDEEALKVLRQNAQRHPADRMALSALAREKIRCQAFSSCIVATSDQDYCA